MLVISRQFFDGFHRGQPLSRKDSLEKKNSAEVLINGKIYTISGYESTAYLHKVASYLNEMGEEISQIENYQRLSIDEKQLLKNMNLADAYFKTSDAKELLEQETERKDKEIYGLKHDLIDAKMELEKLQEQIRELENRLHQEQKQKSRLAQSALNRRIVRPEQKL